MYKNEYLEECLKENKGSHYLNRSYNETMLNKFNDLIIEDLGFIYEDGNNLRKFKNELVNAKIKEFILTDNSTALMKILHVLDSVNVKIKGVKKVEYICIWTNKKEYKKGLLMEVLE